LVISKNVVPIYLQEPNMWSGRGQLLLGWISCDWGQGGGGGEIAGSSTLMFIDSSALWVGPTWQDERPTLSPDGAPAKMFSALLLHQVVTVSTELKCTAVC